LRSTQSPYAIHLRDIPAEGLHRAYELTPAFAESALEGTEVDVKQSNVAAELELFRTGREVLARGTLSGEVVALCSRCVGEAHVALDASLEVLFLPRGADAPAEGDDPLAQPDVVHYDDDIVDVGETLREELLLALPLAPLCREACKGLCPRCGSDLNEGPCDCPEEPKDDRWSILRNVKSTEKSD
jgi:uncharacterized protein